MNRYVLYKFQEKHSEAYLLPRIEDVIREDIDNNFRHHVELPRGSFQVVEFNGMVSILTKRVMEAGDLIMFCDEEDGTEYYRIECVAA